MYGRCRGHYVLLSAFCVGKPLLQFQFAKLLLEQEIREISEGPNPISHSIVRPTAYFKSLDGQIENARKGSPILYFGDGTCAANAICEKDLAKFLADCAVEPKVQFLMLLLLSSLIRHTVNIYDLNFPPTYSS